jgi:DNA polymerase
MPKYNKLVNLKNNTEKCKKCKLYKTRNELVFGEGNLDSKVMFIGEAPGEKEDESGIPFVGDAGDVLVELLNGIGMKKRHVYIANILCCRPTDNRDPDPKEIESCKKRLINQIKIIDPKVICTLGNIATKAFLKSDKKMKDLHGKVYEGRRLLFVSYHPAYATYNPNNFSLLYEDFKKLHGIIGRK